MSSSRSAAEGSPPPARRWAARCAGEQQAGAELNGDARERERELRLITIPTLLTLGRVAAVPLLVSTYHMNGWWATTATTGLFLAAAITDWLDGYIARKMRLGTAFGAFLDPVADKLMVAATLVLLCTKPLEVGIFGEVPWLLTVPSIAIICREITMSAVREWAASKNSRVLEQAVSVNSFGKWKTATQMIALTILLATRDRSLAGPGITVAFGVILLYISAGLALLSLAVYMRKIWKTWAGKTEGSMGADNMFKLMLARGQLRCIGVTTLEEYRKYVEKDAAFERRFQHVFVAEPSVADSISILTGLKEKYEGDYGVRIQDRALVVAAQLRSQYITGRQLPDKVMDLVDEAYANVRVQLDSQP